MPTRLGLRLMLIFEDSGESRRVFTKLSQSSVSGNGDAAGPAAA